MQATLKFFPRPTLATQNLCRRLAAAATMIAATIGSAQGIPGTTELNNPGDVPKQMIEGVSRYLDQEIAKSAAKRADYWHRDFSSREKYDASIQPNRERLKRIIGAVDPRVPNPELEYVAGPALPAMIAETDRFVVHAVRWPVFEGVEGEGLLLQPKGAVVARAVALPDADQTPEMIAGLAPGLPVELQYARRLAESGCQVIVLALADRSERFSGTPRHNTFTNQPHREWIYRPAFILGRHVIGYEVAKITSAVDWLQRQNSGMVLPTAVVGWGEGGLLAFYAAALDSRIDAALVSGYFRSREVLWEEPLYRNQFGLLREFGDAEIASLIAPRTLVVEHTAFPDVKGPPPPSRGRQSAASGRIVPAEFAAVSAEMDRARTLVGAWKGALHLHQSETPGRGVSEAALERLLAALSGNKSGLSATGGEPTDRRKGFDSVRRQERVVRQMENFSQHLLARSAGTREEFLWKKVKPTTPDAWAKAMKPYREIFWTDVIGRLPAKTVPANPRSRLLEQRPACAVYEVLLDVLPGVPAWGYLLLPSDLKPGERRPVVVVQHGGGGVPADVMDEDPNSRGYSLYKAFGLRLAERGFIVFSSFMMNAGHDRAPGAPSTLMLSRKANSIGKTVSSFQVAQQSTLIEWLGTQPNVDPSRIAFYGLSYGGKAAMRVPAIVEGYALSICSADFNEWIWKNVSTDYQHTTIYKPAYDSVEFGLGSTFGYAEMAALIAPRPFMVERGHNDGVALDEWVAFEYAKVNRLYSKLRISQNTEIEYFEGPHTINGVGTFEFLHRHLRWPNRNAAGASR